MKYQCIACQTVINYPFLVREVIRCPKCHNSTYMVIEEETKISKSIRAQEFFQFSTEVINHIETYTVPQYGDFPEDQATHFSIEEIQMNLKRYVNRITSNARGQAERERDCFKIAHYACLLYNKILSLEGTVE